MEVIAVPAFLNHYFSSIVITWSESRRLGTSQCREIPNRGNMWSKRLLCPTLQMLYTPKRTLFVHTQDHNSLCFLLWASSLVSAFTCSAWPSLAAFFSWLFLMNAMKSSLGISPSSPILKLGLPLSSKSNVLPAFAALAVFVPLLFEVGVFFAFGFLTFLEVGREDF